MTIGGKVKKVRATTTMGIGLDESEIDYKVDKAKNKRRRLSLTGKMPHLIIGDGIKQFTIYD